jgi:hypothetical protein
MTEWWMVKEASILRMSAPYPGILFDVVDYESSPGIIVLRFYASNLMDYSHNKLHSIAEWIQLLLDTLNNSNLPNKYTYEIKECP